MENDKACYSFFEKPEPLSRVVAMATLLFALLSFMVVSVGFYFVLEWVLS